MWVIKWVFITDLAEHSKLVAHGIIQLDRAVTGGRDNQDSLVPLTNLQGVDHVRMSLILTLQS